MKKRIIISSFIFTLLLSSSAVAANGTTISKNDESVKVEHYSYFNKDNFKVSVEQKSYSPKLEKSEITTQNIIPTATWEWKASTNLGKAFKFPYPQMQFYSTGESYSPVTIDKISVVTRLYHNGGILNTSTDSQTNSTRAVATAWQDTIILPDTSTYGQSNHTFEHSGYKSWYPETTERYNGWW